MNKFFFFLVSIFISLNLQARDLCFETETTVGFFNGVLTTYDEARTNLRKLEESINIRKASYKEIDYDKINYEIFYNNTFKTGDNCSDNCVYDFVEVFEQMLGEMDEISKANGKILNRYELFWEFIGTQDSWLKQFGLLQAGAVLLKISDKYYEKLASYVNKFTNKDYKLHQEQINKLTKETSEANKLIFVAHSQGNFFANKAYNYAINRKGYSDKSVKIVHIAPASVILNGEHVLIDLDIVITSIQPKNRITDFVLDDMTKYLANAYDSKGHNFIDIYLNSSILVSGEKVNIWHSSLVKVEKALIDIESPEIAEEEKAKKGFFTAMLNWNGDGDVDLRVLEPDGNYITAFNKKGKSGELDVDNRIGFGPEHYYASCNSNKLQTGIYRITVANYGGFKECKNCVYPKPFRIANLYIESNDNGKLSSQSIILGNNLQLNRGYQMIDLKVSKDIFTNKYSVEVINNKPRLITSWIERNKTTQQSLLFNDNLDFFYD